MFTEYAGDRGPADGPYRQPDADTCAMTYDLNAFLLTCDLPEGHSGPHEGSRYQWGGGR